MLAPSEIEAPQIPQGVLILEDEKNARDALTRLLRNRGYQVIPVSAGPQAILEAQHGTASVFLMDIALESDSDGIDVAEQIQSLLPWTSFIFVSAYAHDPKNQDRARRKGIRVGGWFDKPFDLEKVVEAIEHERKKLELLTFLQALQEIGVNPYEHLRSQERALSPQLVEDLYSELELRPLALGESSPDLHAISAISQKIDHIFDQMSRLLTEQPEDPRFEAEARSFRERLHSLQRQEAKAIKLYVRSQLHFDPRESRELLERAEKALGLQ